VIACGALVAALACADALVALTYATFGGADDEAAM